MESSERLVGPSRISKFSKVAGGVCVFRHHGGNCCCTYCSLPVVQHRHELKTQGSPGAVKPSASNLVLGLAWGLQEVYSNVEESVYLAVEVSVLEPCGGEVAPELVDVKHPREVQRAPPGSFVIVKQHPLRRVLKPTRPFQKPCSLMGTSPATGPSPSPPD